MPQVLSQSNPVGNATSRKSSIMDTDPAIMEAVTNDDSNENGGNHGKPGKGNSVQTAIFDNAPFGGPIKGPVPNQRNFFHPDALTEKTKLKFRPLRAKSFNNAKSFFKKNRFSKRDGKDGGTKTDGDNSNESDSSTSTIEDSSSSASSTTTRSNRKSWGMKTKAIFATATATSRVAFPSDGVPSKNALAALSNPPRRTSSFEIVAQLNSVPINDDCKMELTSSGECMHLEASSSSDGSRLLSESFGRVLTLGTTDETLRGKCGGDGISDSSTATWSPSNSTRSMSTDDTPRRRRHRMVATKPPNAPKTSAKMVVDLDDVFEDDAPQGTKVSLLRSTDMLYVKEIMDYLMKREREFEGLIPSPASLGTLARGDTRAILVSWLVQVHDYEGLERESLYLTIRLTDAFCAAVPVELASIQLVGIASLFIASKSVERFPPEGKDLVRYTNNAYELRRLYDMELEILKVLKFEVNLPVSLPFAKHLLAIQEEPDVGHRIEHASFYLLELSLLSKPLILVPPSLIAAAAVFVARFLFLEVADPWPSRLAIASTHSLASFRHVQHQLVNLLQTTPTSKFNASYLKFSSVSQYQSLSKMPIFHNSLSLRRLALAHRGEEAATMSGKIVARQSEVPKRGWNPFEP